MNDEQEKLTTPRETGARRRRWLRVILISVALLLLARLIGGWVAGRQLNQRLADLSAAGQPVRLADVKTPTVPAADDAWPLYKAVLEKAQGLDFEGHAALLEDFAQGPPRSADLIARLGARLEELDGLLDELIAAAARPGVAWPLGSGPLNAIDAPLPVLNRLVQWLQVRAVLRFAAGQDDAAAADLLALVRIANHLGRIPLLYGPPLEFAATQMAADVLQEALPDCDISSERRQALQAALADGVDPQRLLVAVVNTRALSQSLYEQIVRCQLDTGALSGGSGEVTWGTYARQWTLHPLITRDQVNTLDTYERAIGLLGRPYHELAVPLEQLGDRVMAKTGGATLAFHRLDAMNIRQVFHAARTQALSRTCRTMMAAALELAAWRREHGQWPIYLSDVAPTFGGPAADAITGRLLEYVSEPGSARLYSPGFDQADNGGTYDLASDPFGLSGYDYVFFLDGVPDHVWRAAALPATQPASLPATAPQE